MSAPTPPTAIRRWRSARAVFRIAGNSPPDGPWPASVVLNGRRLRVEVRWQDRLISYMDTLDTDGIYRLKIDDPPGGSADLEPNDPDEPREMEGGWDERGGNRGSWTIQLGPLE